MVESPDRLLFPARRVGPPADPRSFERISWDEALDQVVAGLRRVAAEHGPEAICLYSGRGNFELGLNNAFAPEGTAETCANALFFPLGSPNAAGVGSLCYAAFGMIATYACFGGYCCDTRAELERAELILIWGANPAAGSRPGDLRALREARRRGARLISIDHRRSETARTLGAEWVGVRPGTDGALALGLLEVIIAEGLWDREFVDRWTHGFDELRQLTAQYPAERVAAITGVPAVTVIDLARVIAAAAGCSILSYSGLEYADSGVQSIRALWCLRAIAGHLDTPGGTIFRPPGRLQPRRSLTPRTVGARPAIGAAEYPAFFEVRQEAHGALLPRAILEGRPYPVRALVVAGSSLLTSWPEPELWRRALASLDLLVVIDRFPTADAAYAHIVLPATTHFETESYQVHGDDFIQLRQRVIPPRGEARNDVLIFAELAERLGFGDRFPRSEEELIRSALAGTGVTLEHLRAHPEGLRLPRPEKRYRCYERGELRPDGRPGFPTPTGKFELASEWLRSLGYDAAPVYREPVEGPLGDPELARRFPLVFNSGARTRASFRSQHHNIPSLLALEPAPLVTIHPDDARARGIADGDEVDLVTSRGRVTFRARLSADIVPGVVEANMGGGGPLGPESWRRANVNALTDFGHRDPISGFPVYKALLCDVEAR